jgi:hypothetical protein
MISKMLAIHQQYPDMRQKPRQIFITQSRVLASKVEEYFAKLALSPDAGAHSPEELRMTESVVEQEADMVNQEDNKRWRSDLPGRFSELQDEHFPLFITYDRVGILLYLKQSNLTILRADLHNAPE